MKNTKIRFMDIHDNIILEKKLISLTLKEEMIISKSIEFFNDSEPCMIHRSAVMKRMFFELHEYFLNEQKQCNKKVLWNLMPEYLKDYICVPSKFEYVLILED